MDDINVLLPNKEQFDTMNILLAAIASGDSEGLKIKSFEDMQRAVRLGLGSKLFVVGDQIQTERATSISANIAGSTGIESVTLNEDILLNKLDPALYGVFVLTYDGNAWYNQAGESVALSNWGITTIGTAVEGDKIIVNITSGTLTFDVLDFDTHKPKNTRFKHSLLIGMHNIFSYGNLPFSAPQLMYYSVDGLPAGNYKFTLDHAAYGDRTVYDGTYMFTLTQAIPTTGGFRHTNGIGGWKNSYDVTDVIGNYITTYGSSPKHDTIEANLMVSVWDGVTECTDLGTFTSADRNYYVENDMSNNGKRNILGRQAYGSNRWRDSVIRQWLNSNAPAIAPSNTVTISNWWTPQGIFDMPPQNAKIAGFLHGLDPSFVEVMGEVENITSLDDIDKTPTQTYDVTYDKVWLQTASEVYGININGISEGTRLAYWTGTGNSDKIKYYNNTNSFWYLRSPHEGNTNNLKTVSTSGSMQTISAAVAYGIVPTCCII